MKAWMPKFGIGTTGRKNRHQKSFKQKKFQSLNHTGTLTFEGSRHDYHQLIEEGYDGNVIVYRCIALLAKAAASIKVYPKKEGVVYEDHALIELLKEPKPGLSWSSFMEQLVTHYFLSGNAYVEALIDPQEGTLQGLNLLRPDRVTIKSGLYGYPEKYSYSVDTNVQDIFVDQTTGVSRVVHIKIASPGQDWYGQSPLVAAAKAIDMHNAVAKHNLSLLRYGGRPSGALMLRPDEHGVTLTEEQREALRDDLRYFYEGKENAGRLMVLEGNFDWKEMGLSPKSMDFMEGKMLAAREIAQAFGVPSMLVGIPGDATFSNYREARYHLWEETVLPLVDHILLSLTRWMKSLLPGSDWELGYNVEKIHALAPRRERKWQRIQEASFLTVNEKREELGFEPLMGGDSLSSING